MKWLTWASKLQSIAQAGLSYSKDKYDIERFEQISDLAAEIINEYTEVGFDKAKDLFCNEEGYQTPKMDVRAVIFKDDKILMVKESIDDKWSLPGGWADIMLSVKENVIKEAKEEAGIDVVPTKLIALLDRNRHNSMPFPYSVYKAFVLCTPLGGEFKENIETTEIGFFSLSELPPLSLGRVTEKQIEMCFKAAKDPAFETIFD